MTLSIKKWVYYLLVVVAVVVFIWGQVIGDGDLAFGAVVLFFVLMAYRFAIWDERRKPAKQKYRHEIG